MQINSVATEIILCSWQQNGDFLYMMSLIRTTVRVHDFRVAIFLDIEYLRNDMR